MQVLITDCIQYCFAAGDLEMRWMARLCKDCKQRRCVFAIVSNLFESC